ncbi:MAG TPA: D-alanine--D-alanine ligase [Clostridiaceae bacterium]|nr:D-alanine--D-alanine ligase [Clostridiaceae bacterium]
MTGKIHLVVLFGGQSGEHEVSRTSASYIIDTLLTCEEYDIYPVGITKEGSWYYYEGAISALPDGSWFESGPIAPATLIPDTGRHFLYVERRDGIEKFPVDCVFPVLHGSNGEDGTIQGMLEMAGIAFVGCGMTSSALAMDKVFANALFDYCNIPQTKWRWIDEASWRCDRENVLSEALEGLKYPLFIKPARGGSSLGITRITSPEEAECAFESAFKHDRKIIIEEGVVGRELEVAAIGGYETPFLSPVGEIIPDRDFYDYDSKYKESSTSKLIIPAPLTTEKLNEIRQVATRAYQALDCYGLCRIDFFLTDDDRVLLNEINTIPGFVSISMYPRLLRSAGYGDAEVLRELVRLALVRDKS